MAIFHKSRSENVLDYDLTPLIKTQAGSFEKQNFIIVSSYQMVAKNLENCRTFVFAPLGFLLLIAKLQIINKIRADLEPINTMPILCNPSSNQFRLLSNSLFLLGLDPSEYPNFSNEPIAFSVLNPDQIDPSLLIEL